MRTQLELGLKPRPGTWGKRVDRLQAQARALGDAYTGPRWAAIDGETKGSPCVFCPVCLEPGADHYIGNKYRCGTNRTEGEQ